MKKINLLFGILLIASANITAQENLVFEKVIKTDSIEKILLYTIINEWFASTYNSANDVIQMADKDAGTIIGKGSISYNNKCYTGYIKYTIKISVRDHRYKVELNNFNHSAKIGNSASCTFGTLTTATKYTTKGISKKYHNRAWDDMKVTVEQYSNRIFESLEKKTKKIETVEADW